MITEQYHWLALAHTLLENHKKIIIIMIHDNDHHHHDM